MNLHLYGSQYVLASLPIWLSFGILYVVCLELLLVGREHFEEFAYNVAFSSKYGDIGLIACIEIAANVLKRHELSDEWFSGAIYHLVLVCVSFIIGKIVDGKMLVREEIMDRYHNIVIVPLLVYLLVTMLPVTFCYGTLAEKLWSVGLLVLWLIFVVIDTKTGRINQREWLRSHLAGKLNGK